MAKIDSPFEELLREAADNRLQSSAFNAYLTNKSINTDSLCNRIAIAIAERFLAGTVSYDDADAAANALWTLSITGDIYQSPELPGLRGPAMAIYEAFDAGEWRRPTDGDDVDPVERHTRPSLKKILASCSK